MAQAPMRSMNAELDSGLTDGKYKKVVRNRGGFVDADTQDSRQDLHDIYYGIHEAEVKQAPTRGDVRTQNYRATPPADQWA
jgi:hypothetical protein